MRAVLSVIDRVAASSCTVLITGESGTGKELAVAALHDASRQSGGRLVAVNCGAISANLVESELFGHARGAFTGAMNARQGLVAAAEGGTLFLDEVGELPLATQVKLLRLLQAHEYTPVGESRAIHSTARIVAATNRDLAAEVAAGRFREDLYYRLNVIHVKLPALRERREDIAILAQHFLTLASERSGRPDVVSFSADVLAQIVAYDWPGNVRALENVIERAVLLATGPVVDELDGLPPVTARPSFRPRLVPSVPAGAPASPASSSSSSLEDDADADADEEIEAMIDLRAEVEAFENNLISGALKRAGNNRTKAAQLLGLQRTTLVEMLKRKRLAVVPRAA